MSKDIDFVIIWVDGNDLEWQKEKSKYSGEGEFNVNNVRYRDWGNLHYWFRAVEQYAPWVRKIHFVTCGHVPEWLNLEHPKLHFVKHSEYMKSEYLPTFSANPIELNLHRIEGLADQFVYFNDDTFLNASVQPEDFFVHGLPCDCAALGVVHMERRGISNIITNDLCVLNDHFNFVQSFKTHLGKWMSPKYKGKLIRTLLMLPWRFFTGFFEPHLPNAYLKQTFEELWEKEGPLLDTVSRNKFRSKEDVNQFLMRYWQLASGKFVPRSVNFGKMYSVGTQMPQIIKELSRNKYKMICINDSEAIEDFSAVKKMVNDAFEQKFPKKSQFEK